MKGGFRFPEALQKHYRYIDQYNLLNEEAFKGTYQGEVTGEEMFEHLNQYGYYDWDKNCSIKFFLNSNYDSWHPEDSTIFGISSIRFGADHQFASAVYTNDGEGNISLVARGYLPKYSYWNGAGTQYESTLIAYFYYNDQIIDGSLVIHFSTGNAAFDNMTSSGEGDYNESYMYRNNDQGENITNLSLSANQITFFYKYFQEHHRLKYPGGVHATPIVQPITRDEYEYSSSANCPDLQRGNFRSVCYDLNSANLISESIEKDKRKKDYIMFKKEDKGGLL